MNRDKLTTFFDVLTKIGLGGIFFFIPISNALISIFAGLTFFGFLGKKIVKPDFQWLKHKQNIFLILFFIFMGLSLTNSGQYLGKSLIALFLKWGKYIALSLIVQDSITKRKDIFIFVGIFMFSSVLVALSGITQLFWGVEFLRGRNIMLIASGVRAINSSFNHYNNFGAYLIIPFLLCVAFVKAPRVLKSGISYFILLLGITLAFCIFHTYSRGTWIGVLVGLMTMFVISRRPRIIFAIIFIIGIILFIPMFQGRFFSIFQAGGDADRFRYWQAAISMFKENPFLGKGLGTFMAHFAEYLPNVGISYAHNCFLQILAESGIFSLVFFLTFLCLVLYIGIKKFFSERDPVLLGGICGLTGFLVHSFFDTNLYSLALAILFWLWVGIVAALGSGKASQNLGEI